MSFIKQIKKKQSELSVLVHLYFFHALTQITNIALPLLTVPHLVRHLGLEGFGKYSFIVIVSYCIGLIPDYGFTQAAPIYLQNKNDSYKSFYLNLVFKSRIVLGFLGVLFLCLFPFFKSNYFSIPILAGSALWIFGVALNPTWFLQGEKQIRFVSLSNLFTKVIFTVVVFVLVKDKNDLGLLVLIYGITNFVYGLISLFPLRNRLRIERLEDFRSGIFENLKDHFPYFKFLFNNNVLANSGGLLLNYFHGASNLGFYSSYEKLNKGILGLFGPVSSALYPFMSKEYDKSPISFGRNLLTISAACIFGFCVLFFAANLYLESISKVLFNFYYPDSKWIFLAFSIWSILGIINNFLGSQYLTIVGKISIYNKVYTISTVLFVLICLWSIPRFGPKGLVITMAFTEGIIAIMQGLFVYRSLNSK